MAESAAASSNWCDWAFKTVCQITRFVLLAQSEHMVGIGRRVHDTWAEGIVLVGRCAEPIRIE